MDMTLGEVLEMNPLYAQGEFFDADFYKRMLPRHEVSQVIISDEMRQNGFRHACLEELASSVASIALLVIPSIVFYGASQFVFTVGMGVAWGLMSSTPIGDRNQLGFIARLRAKGDIIAGLSQTGRYYQWIKKDFLIPTLFKVGLYKWMSLPYRVAGIAPFFITGVLSYKIAKFIDRTLFSLIDRYVEHRRQIENIQFA